VSLCGKLAGFLVRQVVSDKCMVREVQRVKGEFKGRARREGSGDGGIGGEGVVEGTWESSRGVLTPEPPETCDKTLESAVTREGSESYSREMDTDDAKVPCRSGRFRLRTFEPSNLCRI